MSPRSNRGGGPCGAFSHPSTRERLRTPWRTASMPPPASPAATVAPAPTPGVASNSRASVSTSSLSASMPWRASSRVQIRALTRGVGRRSSSANIIRRRIVSLTPRGLFMVQRVGVGAASSSRCMNTLEPVLRWAMRENGPKSPHAGKGSERRSSISSKRRSEPRFPASRRWASLKLLEPFAAYRLVAPVVRFADAVERHAEPLGEDLAELRLPRTGRAVEKDVHPRGAACERAP